MHWMLVSRRWCSRPHCRLGSGIETRRLPFSDPLASRPQTFRAVGMALALLALCSAARAAEYIVQATVTDIDDRPLSGIQIAAGTIKKEILKSSVEAGTVGTTDAAGQVTLSFSSDA